jgi:hypothetical protein
MTNNKLLINKLHDFQAIFPKNTPSDMVDIMDSFYYIKPLAKKSDEMVFSCTCKDAYQAYCCVESVILSLLFNPELEVPDIARLKQFKERERKWDPEGRTSGTWSLGDWYYYPYGVQSGQQCVQEAQSSSVCDGESAGEQSSIPTG